MNIKKLIVSLLITFSAAGIGTVATIPNIPSWYAALEKPFFSPPNWIFGPVWTVLYILIALSFYLVWTRTTKQPKLSAYKVFARQTVLNVLWSIVFFGLHLPWLGLVVILALLATIIAMMVIYYKISRVATYLLIPYLAWVTFASCLNFAVALLN